MLWVSDERNLSSYFNISADTGWIYLQTRIDREDSLLTQLFGVIELTVKVSSIWDLAFQFVFDNQCCTSFIN